MSRFMNLDILKTCAKRCCYYKIVILIKKNKY